MLGTFSLSSVYYDAYYSRAQKVRTLIKQDFEKAFEKVDLIMGPVSPYPAFKIGEKINDPVAMYLADIYTGLVNMASLNGLSIPCGFVEREGKNCRSDFRLSAITSVKNWSCEPVISFRLPTRFH